MLVVPVMTMLCTAGVGFSVRFLVALCKECEPRRIGYWVRLRLSAAEDATADSQQIEVSKTNAA